MIPMKKTIRGIGVLLVACLLVLVLPACSKKAVALSWRDGAFRSADGQTAFLEAPYTFWALSALTGSAVARITGTGTEDILLYAIEGLDPGRYLADRNLTLYYAEGVTLPSVSEMSPTQATLYNYTESRVNRSPVAVLENREQVADLAARFDSGAKIPGEKITQELYNRMEVLFFSVASPGIGRMLEYRMYEEDVAVYEPLNADGTAPDTYPGLTPQIETVAGETVAVWHLGKKFLYDRGTKTYTPIGEVLEEYFIGDETGE